MINIGFLLAPSTDWLGGVNYFRNLFLAVDLVAGDRVRIFAFVPANVEDDVVERMCGGLHSIEIVRTRLLVRGSWPWLIWRVTRRLSGSDLWLSAYLRRYRLALFSHSSVFHGRSIRAVNWIPDFQHLHLPEFFPPTQVKMRNRAFREISERSDVVVLSSQAAADDYRRFAPRFASKARVLRFVSHVPAEFWKMGPNDVRRVTNKYGITRPFVYLPNQFWQHKNHEVVFRAFSLLKAGGADVELVCTGTMSDFRNPDYVPNLRIRISELGIEDRVKLLGVVPYEDVYALMSSSVCVVNPSRFEGWSSTVEECKSVGKQLVLSDIPVHREQAADALFFPPDNAQVLADLFEHVFSSVPARQPVRNDFRTALENRTREFGLQYLSIIWSVLSAERGASVDDAAAR